MVLVDFRPGKDGATSSTSTMRAVMEASAAAVDRDAATAVAAEKDFRNRWVGSGNCERAM